MAGYVNKAMIVGNVGSDPEIKEFQDGNKGPQVHGSHGRRRSPIATGRGGRSFDEPLRQLGQVVDAPAEMSAGVIRNVVEVQFAGGGGGLRLNLGRQFCGVEEAQTRRGGGIDGRAELVSANRFGDCQHKQIFQADHAYRSGGNEAHHRAWIEAL